MKVTDEQLKTWTPRDFWGAYKTAVYNGEKLPEKQEKECSNAFFAGLHAGFEFQIMAACQLSETDAVAALERFQKELEVVALAQNPTRQN